MTSAHSDRTQTEILAAIERYFDGCMEARS